MQTHLAKPGPPGQTLIAVQSHLEEPWIGDEPDIRPWPEPGWSVGTRGDMSEEAAAVADQTRDTGSLRYEILGAFRVTRNGTAVHLGGARQRAVLALLLLDPNPPVPVARLADALWGERPPPAYATTIQTYVFHLSLRLNLRVLLRRPS